MTDQPTFAGSPTGPVTASPAGPPSESTAAATGAGPLAGTRGSVADERVLTRAAPPGGGGHPDTGHPDPGHPDPGGTDTGRPDAGAGGLAYRPGLDGLRAVAVGAVLLYHGGVTWLPGGFTGVDVFFVLSGFLITALLLHEHDRSGTLRLRNFWIRRARRLLPALTLVVAAVLVLFPALGVRWPSATRGDAVATLLHASNWWFLSHGQSYALAFEDPSPFQHTWSLAIEEQWYLLLPLVLLVVLRTRHGRRWLGPALAGLALGSAALMAWLSFSADGPRLYYGTDTRLQGLLVGAALAAGVASSTGRRILRRLPAAVLAGLGWVGLAVLAGAFLVGAQSDLGMYRGGFLGVALASALVILAVIGLDRPGAPPGGTPGLGAGGVLSPVRWLGSRPLVVVGLLSYGVYLWHWPVFLVLSPERTGIDGGLLLVLRVAATGALAALSFVLVERPLRVGARPHGLTSPVVAAPIVAVALAAATIGLLVPGTVGGGPGPSDSVSALADTAARQRGGGNAVGTGPTTLLLVGDSNALSLFTAVKDAPGGDVRLAIATRFGCGVVPYTAAIEDQPYSPEEPLCGDWAVARETEIANAHPTVGVLFVGSWEQYDRWIGGRTVPYTDPEWMRETSTAYLTVLREILRAADRAVVVLNHCHQVPETGLPAGTMFAAGRYPPVLNDPRRVAATNEAARRAVAAAGAEPGQVTVVDPNPFLCPSGYTETKDGVRLRTDGLHLTTEGGQLLWTWLRPRLTS